MTFFPLPPLTVALAASRLPHSSRGHSQRPLARDQTSPCRKTRRSLAPPPKSLPRLKSRPNTRPEN